MNRRSFFETTAALLPAALLCKSAIAASPREVDITDAGAAAHLANRGVELIFRMEEPDLDDRGELSGSVLRIVNEGGDVLIHAGIGDVLQRAGYRTTHFLGWTDAHGLASIDPATTADGAFVRLVNTEEETYYGCASLTLMAGQSPELRLCISTHCFGVLRGELLTKFFHCLRVRGARA